MPVARTKWKQEYGFSYLLGSSAKIDKSNKSGSGFYSEIMYLAPYKLSGHNVCPWASQGCILSCLNESGMAVVYPDIIPARIKRTELFFNDRKTFIKMLISEIARVERKAAKLGRTAAIRLNGTSDLSWEKIAPELFTLFPKVVFYDYTKGYDRMFADLPANYSLTFSRSEANETKALEVLQAGKNVAVVFSGKTLPDTWKGYKVIDADLSDERFLDTCGYVAGLLPKGKAKNDTSGFVVQQ